MPRTTREQAAEHTALLGQFIFWAGALDANQTPYLLGPQHVAAIKAAAEVLFAQMSSRGKAERQKKIKK